MDEGYTLLKDDIRRIGRVVLDAERSQVPTSAPRVPQYQAAGRPPIVVMLLDNCESGQQVQGAVLEDLTTNETQVVSFLGDVSGGYYRLGFRPSDSATETEWTARLDPLVATAADIQAALEALPSISPGDVQVSFGVVETDDGERHVINRFSVTFAGRYVGQNVEMLEVDAHLDGSALDVEATNVLEDSGRVESVREVLGVGTPTPLRAGARAYCSWVHGIGFVIVSVEARNLGDYGLGF